MNEKELMNLVLQDEAPDFDAVERVCLKELRRPRPIRYAAAAAAVVALVALGLFFIKNFGGRDVQIPPSNPSHTLDLSGGLFMEGGNMGGEEDIPCKLIIRPDGSLFDPYENLDGAAYTPKLLSSDLPSYAASFFEAGTARYKGALLKELERLCSLFCADFSAFSEADNAARQGLYAFRDVFFEPGNGEAYRYFVLDADLGDAFLTIAPDDVYLHIKADTELSAAIGALYGTGQESAYPSLLAGNAYVDSFFAYCGIKNPVYFLTAGDEDGYGVAVVEENGVSGEALIDGTLIRRVSVRPRLSVPDDANAAPSAEIILRLSRRFGGETADLPDGVTLRTYEDCKDLAVSENPGLPFVGATVRYALTADAAYYVPCYCFFFETGREEDAVLCKMKILCPLS